MFDYELGRVASPTIAQIKAHVSPPIREYGEHAFADVGDVA